MTQEIQNPDQSVTPELSPNLAEGMGTIEAAVAAMEAAESAQSSEPEPEAAPVEEPEAQAPEQEAESATESDTGDEPDEDPTVKASWELVKSQERKLIEARKALKAEREEIEALRAQFKPSDIPDRLKTDPLAVLQEHGITFDQLADRILSDGKPSEKDGLAKIEEHTASLEKRLAEKVEALEAQITRREQEAAVHQYTEAIRQTLNGDQFELLRGYPDAADSVLSFVQNYVQQNGEYISPEQAASYVQNQIKEHLGQLRSNKAALAVLGLSPSDAVSPPRPASQGSTKTLTNKLSAAPTEPGQSLDDLPEHERLKRLAEML